MIFFFFITFCSIYAQNLISNGSFEHFSVGQYPEPNIVSGGTCPTDWVYVNTIDNYLSTQTAFWCCEPSNAVAQNGDVYIGLIGYAKDVHNYREYAIGLINKPLVRGHRYAVSFYLQYSHTSAIFIEQFHLFFLNGKVHFSNNIRDGVPDTVKVISIPMNKKYLENWSLISDTIIATGDEVEIGIGNLVNNDEDLKYENVNTDAIIKREKFKLWDNHFAYVFLDNVSLIDIDSENEHTEPKNRILKRNTIRFKFNDTTILTQYYDTLKLLISTIKQMQSEIKLTGYTDSIGDYSYNLLLSQNRANAIKNILIKNGIPSNKITVDYKSYLYPLMSNETEEERSANRRVEISLIYSTLGK